MSDKYLYYVYNVCRIMIMHNINSSDNSSLEKYIFVYNYYYNSEKIYKESKLESERE